MKRCLEESGKGRDYHEVPSSLQCCPLLTTNLCPWLLEQHRQKSRAPGREVMNNLLWFWSGCP